MMAGDSYTRQAAEDDWRRAGERRASGMPLGMRSICDVMPRSFGAKEEDGSEIKDAASSAHLQWAVAIMDFERRRLADGFGPERVARDVAQAEATCARIRKHCESPIEHQLVPWLMCQNYGQWKCACPAAHIPSEDHQPPDAELMIIPQFAFARFRIDFALVAKYREHLRIVAIECDGAAFHKDAVKDFRRDLYLIGWNIPTVRAAGSEITRNPRQVAERVARYVIDWACALGLDP